MIFDGKNGPRFLPGQVIESEDGDERFIPGQIMDSLEDGIKRFVPGRNSPSFLNVFSLETFWVFLHTVWSVNNWPTGYPLETSREPAVVGFHQKDQIGVFPALNCPYYLLMMYLGLEIKLIWPLIHGGFPMGLWLLHHWQTTGYVVCYLRIFELGMCLFEQAKK